MINIKFYVSFDEYYIVNVYINLRKLISSSTDHTGYLVKNLTRTNQTTHTNNRNQVKVSLNNLCTGLSSAYDRIIASTMFALCMIVHTTTQQNPAQILSRDLILSINHNKKEI